MNPPINSLWPTPKDERDFNLGAVVGNAVPADLPDEYEVAKPLIIKDQGQGTDMCTAYALTSVSEDEESVVLDPFFTFGVTKAITGNSAEWGADLRSACKSAVKPRTGSRAYGSLEAKDLSKLTNPATQADRERAADYGLITDEEIREAKKHAKKSFFSVDGPGDFFDNIRSAMWMTRNEERSIFTGCNWRTVWTYGGGTIETAPSGQTFGHAVKAFGWRGGYIKLQLSNGKSIGEDGIFWISRLALNQAFTFGAFTFLDMPREDAEKTIAESKKSRTFFTRMISPFANLFDKLQLCRTMI